MLCQTPLTANNILCTLVFDSHLRYRCQIWGQRWNKYIKSIEKTQNKVIRILNFKGPREGAENLYKESKKDEVRNSQLSICIWSTTKKASRKFQWLFYFEHPPTSSQN